MGLSLWTFAGDGTGTEATDIKKAGTGSYKAYISGSGTFSNTLTRNDFTCTDIEVIVWRKMSLLNAGYGISAYSYVRHPSYGNLQIGYITAGGPSSLDWDKYRVWFWYDSVSKTRFGRIEKWVTNAWVQQGSDANFGTGSPTAASIALKMSISGGGPPSGNATTYFDELEAYDVVVE